jgi:membrane-associated phospholipid phosphatase
MIRPLIAICLSLLFGTFALAGSDPIEPKAGNWKTWIISSGKDYRVAPPPDAAATKAEIVEMHDLMTKRNTQIDDQITFWDAGSPAYRWVDLLNTRILYGDVPPNSQRIYAYLTLAMADATIAAWESKYFYNRPRPIAVNPTLSAVLPTPDSPSYPSEHAVTAGAAAVILAHFFPQEAASFEAMAKEAALSRVQAGVQFPSDSAAGLALGRRVAERVIEVAKADGSDAVWSGTVPTGPCMWMGTKPGNVTMPNWKPILLARANEFRPPAPPDCHSDALKAEVDAVRNFKRSFDSNYKAFYWQSPAGTMVSWFDFPSRWMFEDKTDRNAPRAARTYAMLAATWYDAFIASNDGKFAYWYLRPHQLDSAIDPIFPVPNFPSYPSNHSTLSTARCEVLAYLFPKHAEFIRKLGKQAGDSRIWAGIHYPIDNRAGVELGKAVAAKYIARAQTDGAD